MKQTSVKNRVADLIARLTHGAVPIDGIIRPVDSDVQEARPVPNRVPQPRDELTSESEFDLAIFPKWGNFR